MSAARRLPAFAKDLANARAQGFTLADRTVSVALSWRRRPRIGYGVIVGENQSHNAIPQVQSLTVRHDTIDALMTQTANEVTITGQNGKVLALARHTDRISYRITPDDRYARVTFKYANGTEILLNPVFFTPKNGYQPTPVYENFNETMFFRSVGTCILGGWLLLVARLITGQRPQRYGRRRLSWR